MGLRTLSLFSGGLGLDRGVALAIPARTVCYVEFDAQCQRLIQARIRDSSVDDAPIWDDARTFDGSAWRGAVDIVIGGPPCQPISVAGRRRGHADDRWLWPATLDIVEQCRPPLVFFENPTGIIRLGLDGIIQDLSAMGYHVAARIVTAAEVGAPHLRERIFILGYRDGGVGQADATGTRRAWGQDAGTSSGDASADGRRGEQPQRDGGDVALPNGGEREEGQRRAPGQAQGGRPRHRPARPGGVLADAGSVGSGVQLTRRGAQGGAAAGWAGAGMGMADTDRESGRGQSDAPERETERRATTDRSGATVLPPFPPARNDWDGWGAVLARWPELAPALPAEPRVRKLAHGLGSKLDQSELTRAQQLRILGNGVVPIQAAHALRLLCHDLGIEWLVGCGLGEVEE
jgi:DNA (cytosine-5)-methyltransferase 1